MVKKKDEKLLLRLAFLATVLILASAIYIVFRDGDQYGVSRWFFQAIRLGGVR